MKRLIIDKLEERMDRTEMLHEDSRTIAMDRAEMERIYRIHRRTDRRRRTIKRLLSMLMFWRWAR